MTADVIYPLRWNAGRASADSHSAQDLCEFESGVNREHSHEESPANGELMCEILDKVEQLRHLALAGKVNSLVIVARDPLSGLMLTDICVDRSSDGELFQFVGALETVKIELSDEAMFSPVLQLDGSILDPRS